MLIRNAEIDGEVRDLRIINGVVSEIGNGLSEESEIVDASGSALIRGLIDNHIHLCAFAAARESLHLKSLADIAAAHARMSALEPLRVVDFHEDTHGALDRFVLDALAPGRIVRVQHQTGRAWILSTAALRDAGIEHETGVLVGDEGADLPSRAVTTPDLLGAGQALGCVGLTQLTDATPYESASDASLLIEAVNSGQVLQRVSFMGGPAMSASVPSGFEPGPVKVVVGDHDLPSVEDLVAIVKLARAHNRAVAFHCVTPIALAIIVATMKEAGASPLETKDRIEHGAIIPDEYLSVLKELQLCVVTQPSFVRNRGDRYLRTVDASDQPFLYRCGMLIEAGIGVYGSSDAPYGSADPWQSMRTVVERHTSSGALLGVSERATARDALLMFLNSPESPWRNSTGPQVGDPADLVLLTDSLKTALDRLDASLVRSTFVSGNPVFVRA